MNLKELIKSTEKYNEKVLYKCNNKEILYKDANEYIKALGTALIGMGLKNKKIAILSENRYEWEIAFFSVACGTGIIVPIDKNSTKAEIENIINKVKVEAVFCSEKYENTLQEIKNNNQFLKYIISFDANNEKSFENLIDYGQELIDQNDKSFIDAVIDDEEICLISFSSGTTGASKAVELSQKNIYLDITNTAKVFDINEKDICLSVLPLSHVLEGIFCFLLSIYNGAERIFCNEIDEIIEYIKKYKITYIGAVPAIYEYLYERKDELLSEVEHINMFMSGGASLNPELVTKYKEIGINLVQGYGITECSSVISIENKKYRKIGSVGKSIPNIEIKLIDKDSDGIGEILIKGETVTKGYYEDEKTTEKMIKDGWFHTGDLGRIDEEGFIYICGRSKDVIVLQNGKKVFSEEIERVINKIEGVKESFVFLNNIDKIFAELVYEKNKFINKSESEIKIVLMENIKQINETLSQYKRISEIIITTENIERTPIGKIQRNKEQDKISKIIKNEELDIKNDDNFSDFENVKKIITKQLGSKEISLDSDIVTDLGADSLDKVGIFLQIEKNLI